MKLYQTIATAFTCLFALNGYSQLPYQNENLPIEVRVQDALSRMTLEEKVKLCTAQSKFSSHGVPRLGIPELWMSDGPHGVRMEIMWDTWDHAQWTNDSCTAFPALSCLAATWNPDMAYLYGKSLGEEARYREKDVILGPGVNIYRTPLNGRNFEYMGEDPVLSSTMVVPYVKGVQENGVAACVKHFALNNQENCRDFIDVQIDDRTLFEIYLPAFEAAVKEGKVWSLMGSYNQIRGQHGCHNDFLLNKVLKGKWNFDGCVISDWGGAHDTRQAALNGLDIEMGTWTDGLAFSASNAYDKYYLAAPYLKMLKDGEIPVGNVNDKAARILRLMFRTAMNSRKPWGSFASEAHFNAAKEIAEEGIVLLKNEGGLLPLADNYRHILVVGENAVRPQTPGGGSSELKVKVEVSPLEGLVRALGKDKITFARGYTSDIPERNGYVPFDRDSLLQDAVEKAGKADLVIFVGGLNKNWNQDCEGGDRFSYELPYGQNELLAALRKANKKVVAVIISGNAYDMPWQNDIPAIVQGWYMGSAAGAALADVLTGKTSPSGKLPFSFPEKLEDCPAHHFGKMSYPGDSVKVEYKEGILVGYRWYDTKKIAPRYAFGHGLSYTEFEYGKIQLDNGSPYNADDEVIVKVPVRNTGKVAGKEVVQLYVKDDEFSVLRPEKELKAFRKIALEPGEEKVVTFKLDKKAWRYYDENKADWNVEPGKFTILIGSSSRDIRQKATLSIEG